MFGFGNQDYGYVGNQHTRELHDPDNEQPMCRIDQTFAQVVQVFQSSFAQSLRNDK